MDKTSDIYPNLNAYISVTVGEWLGIKRTHAVVLTLNSASRCPVISFLFRHPRVFYSILIVFLFITVNSTSFPPLYCRVVESEKVSRKYISMREKECDFVSSPTFHLTLRCP